MDNKINLPRYVTDVDHGASDLVVDHQLSLDVAEAVEAEPKGCFIAAYRTVDDGVLENAIYIEGYVLHPDLPLPIQHAWVEWGEDRIVDPTYCSFSPNPGRLYFPGIRLTWEEMMALNEAYPDAYLPYSDFCYDHPELHTAVREAYYAANDALSPGLGAQMRQMDEEVTRHNREVWARAQAEQKDDDASYSI